MPTIPQISLITIIVSNLSRSSVIQPAHIVDQDHEPQHHTCTTLLTNATLLYDFPRVANLNSS